MASRLVAAVCAWAVLTLLGCGRAEGGGKPIPQGELPERVANLLCDSLASCCKSSGFPIDTAGCKAAYTAELEAELELANRQGFLRYDAEAAGDCLAAASANIQCGQIDGDEAPACGRVIVGTIALGQPCNSSHECAPVAGGRPVDCDSEDGESVSVCTANSNEMAPRGQAGDACDKTCFEGESCWAVSAPVPQPGTGNGPAPSSLASCYRDDGLYCGVGGCAPLVAVGAPCDFFDACGGRAFCDYDTGLCSAPRPYGSSCQGNDECQSGTCLAQSAAPADPMAAIPLVCGSLTVVTAERCETASIFNAPDGTAPAQDPGAGAGGP